MTPKERSMANLIPAKPGEVRNKTGKPPGTLNSKTILARLLKNKGTYTDPRGKVWRMPKLALMFQGQIDLAIEERSTQAFNAVLDRWEGKAVQPQQIGFEEGAAEITVRIGKSE